LQQPDQVPVLVLHGGDQPPVADVLQFLAHLGARVEKP
jgi:hypothetical protein